MEAPAEQKEPSPTDETLPLPTLSPAVPTYVTLGLTVVYTVFYSLLFIFVYVQLWLVLRYRHKRFSYQTAFLSLCLLWSALRTVLFSFYFKNFVTANTLGPFPFWLLYCFPVCLQFFTLSLMNLYLAQVVFKAKSKYAPELLRYRLPLYLLFLSISLVFLVVNLACALLVRMSSAEARTIVLVRVAINDTLFVLCAVSLSLCLYKVAKMSLANIYLESKGTSVCQVTAVGAIVILLYSSRACYNLVVLGLSNKSINSFDYDWYNVSDQADLRSTLGDGGYVVFGVILFVWELLPTSLVVFFFRVRQPDLDRNVRLQKLTVWFVCATSRRVATGSLVTSSPPGVISSTTRGDTTATTTWRGASCLRTSKQVWPPTVPSGGARAAAASAPTSEESTASRRRLLQRRTRRSSAITEQSPQRLFSYFYIFNRLFAVYSIHSVFCFK